MPEPTPKVGFVSLGCPKATVDSERILTQLRAEGYCIVPDYGEADLVIINTCGFVEEAVAESLEAIDEALTENGRVIVTGCLGAKGDIVRTTFPELLSVTGPNACSEVLEAVHARLPPRHDPYTSLLPPGGIKLTPRHYAYLKIAEGCNHRCSFCIIPSLRGKLASRPLGEVMAEAEALVSAGVKELLIVSQDTSAYGADLGYRFDFLNGRPLRTRFYDLAATLGELGVWVRLHYVYPYPHVDQVIDLMAEGRILPYLDVPLQHASPTLLKAMKRPANAENMLRRIEGWREVCPSLTLRSTFIVGFPGETEKDFDLLLDFLKEAQLDRVGAFSYSPVEGAAANRLPGQVAEEVKEERLQRFMAMQAGISEHKLVRKIGTHTRVLIDDANGLTGTGRTSADAPDIDGVVHVTANKPLRSGEFVEVSVSGADEHDLWGRVI